MMNYHFCFTLLDDIDRTITAPLRTVMTQSIKIILYHQGRAINTVTPFFFPAIKFLRTIEIEIK
jgi:hypothetical protein